MISNERASLAEFLGSGKGPDIARYLLRTPKMQEDILKFNESVDITVLAEHLNSKGKPLKQALNFLEEYLEVRAPHMPVSNIPGSARWSSSREEAKDNYKLGKHRLARGSVFLGAVDLTAAAMSAFGLTVRERQLALTLLLTSTAAAGLTGQAQASVSQSDVHSALNDFNTSSHSDTFQPLKIIIDGGVETIEAKSDYLLSPYLVQKLEKSVEARQYMVWIVDAAEKNGLDPVLFANQLFRESMHFKESVIHGPDVSPAGAMGIGQFMDYTGPSYGLQSTADYFDPHKSIYAAARMMSDLTADYDNDQILALAAYNGGAGAVDYVAEATGDNSLTGTEWLNFMNNRYEEIGVTSKSAWHVETRGYIADITGQDWDSGYKQWAVQLQGGNALQYVETILSGNAAVSAVYNLALSPNNG